jgi:hypothetical protein
MKLDSLMAKLMARFVTFCLCFGIYWTATAADFNVTTPGFFYSINGHSSNPTLTLTRGMTYTFAINAASNHPFEILSGQGVSNNNISTGTITFSVPTNAPNSITYFCSIHGFGGTMTIVNPPPPAPPSVKLISVTLTKSNVTIKSTGTNGWTAVPEFNSNLTTRTWRTVPSYTNRFAGGTNFTTFNRLEAICGSNVFLRVRNTNN